MRKYDVVIVGAGPTGTVTAAALRKYIPEASVALIDKDGFPRDKACGDGLGPNVVKELEDLDLSDLVTDYPAVTHVTVRAPSGAEVTGRISKLTSAPLSGYVVPRLLFDAALVEAVVERGVAFFPHHKVRSITQNDDRVVVEATTNGTGVARFASSCVVAADGAYSTVRRLLGIAPPRKLHLGVATRAYCTGKWAQGSPPSLTLTYEGTILPAYGWMFPIGSGQFNVGIGITQKALDKTNMKMKDAVRRLVVQLNEHSSVALSSPQNFLSHRLIHGLGLKSITAGRVALCGDAASMMNSLSGEGIAYGMSAGHMLAKSLGRYGFWGSSLFRALSDYERSFRRRYRGHYASNLVALQMMGHRRWAEAAVQAAGEDETVLEDAVDLMFGDGRLGLASTLRIAGKGVGLR